MTSWRKGGKSHPRLVASTENSYIVPGDKNSLFTSTCWQAPR